MSSHDDLFLELFADLDHFAPGSRDTTLRALDALAPLPDAPRIADLGCGHGASALVLAEATGGRVLAIDAMAPFVADVRERAADAGLGSRVDARVGDMAAPPVAPGSLDLVWSEGAAYAIGFDTALATWRPLLKPGGGIGVSELVWTSHDPPEDALTHWTDEYPAMRHADAVRASFEAADFTVVEAFLQPRSDWSAYYEPLEAALPGFRARHAGDPTAQAIADRMAAEKEAWSRWEAHFGYLFLVGRRT